MDSINCNGLGPHLINNYVVGLHNDIIVMGFQDFPVWLAAKSIYIHKSNNYKRSLQLYEWAWGGHNKGVVVLLFP